MGPVGDPASRATARVESLSRHLGAHSLERANTAAGASVAPPPPRAPNKLFLRFNIPCRWRLWCREAKWWSHLTQGIFISSTRHGVPVHIRILSHPLRPAVALSLSLPVPPTLFLVRFV